MALMKCTLYLLTYSTFLAIKSVCWAKLLCIKALFMDGPKSKVLLKKSSADHSFSQFDNSTWPLADFSRVGRTRILHDTRSRQISAAGALPPRCLLEPPVLPGRPTCAAFKGLPLRIDWSTVVEDYWKSKGGWWHNPWVSSLQWNWSALGAVSGRERTQYGRVVKTGASEKEEEENIKRSEQRDHTR